ncbi:MULTISPECIES: hypothetical protein [unclassified Prevotella]|uniref:hypothetical protein n=1 Tax=unclassified Prevotella TaxID=2638335 RepID=UPI000490345F|nr:MULTISPECIES: hypothetical protein [unclassified Prevotella]
MKETKKELMAVFCVFVAYALGTVVLFETNIFESGFSTDDSNLEFLITAVMELVTLGGVFLGLRLFKFQKVHNDLVTRKYDALRKWGTLRLVIIGLPMMVNTYLYYMFLNTTFGYMAIIQLLCLPFIYPSMSRCEAEVEDENEGENAA